MTGGGSLVAAGGGSLAAVGDGGQQRPGMEASGGRGGRLVVAGGFWSWEAAGW